MLSRTLTCPKLTMAYSPNPPSSCVSHLHHQPTSCPGEKWSVSSLDSPVPHPVTRLSHIYHLNISPFEPPFSTPPLNSISKAWSLSCSFRLRYNIHAEMYGKCTNIHVNLHEFYIGTYPFNYLPDRSKSRIDFVIFLCFLAEKYLNFYLSLDFSS